MGGQPPTGSPPHYPNKLDENEKGSTGLVAGKADPVAPNEDDERNRFADHHVGERSAGREMHELLPNDLTGDEVGSMPAGWKRHRKEEKIWNQNKKAGLSWKFARQVIVLIMMSFWLLKPSLVEAAGLKHDGIGIVIPDESLQGKWKENSWFGESREMFQVEGSELVSLNRNFSNCSSACGKEQNEHNWICRTLVEGSRFGEAASPGPDSKVGLSIIVVNISTSGGKHADDIIEMLKDQKPAVMILSETRSTELRNRQAFTKYQKAGLFSAWSEGAPADDKHAGVGIVSTEPIKKVNWASTCGWRFLRSHISLEDGKWADMIALYGKFNHNEKFDANTDGMIHEAWKALEGSKNPFQVIAGDFNNDSLNSLSYQEMKTNGWIDVEEWNHRQTGEDMRCTFFGSGQSRIDTILVNNRMAARLHSVQVADMPISGGHRPLQANFIQNWVEKRPLMKWKLPSKLPLEQLDEKQRSKIFQVDEKDGDIFKVMAQDVERACQKGDTDEALRIISRCGESFLVTKAIESALIGKDESDKFLGRCVTAEPTVIEGTRSNKHKKVRSGDFQLAFTLGNVELRQRSRQARRLQDLVRQMRHYEKSKDACDEDGKLRQREHIEGCWSAACRAPGFKPSFLGWLGCLYEDEVVRPDFTWKVPNVEDAEMLYRRLELHVTLQDQAQNRMKYQEVNEFFQQDYAKGGKVIFAKIKPPRPEAISHLEVPVETKVVRSCTRRLRGKQNGWLSVENGSKFDLDLPVQLDGKLYRLLGKSETMLGIVGLTQGPEPGAKVTQSKWIYNIPELQDELMKFWMPIWQRHNSVENNRWEAALSLIDKIFSDVDLPELHWQQVTLDDWKKSIRKMKTWSRRGVDAWSKSELLALPDEVHQQFIFLVNKVEEGLSWPSIMLEGIVTALKKSQDARTVNQYRPITVLSTLWRVYARARAGTLLQWLSKWLPRNISSYLQGREVADSYYETQMLIEHALNHGLDIAGGTLDLEKAFNRYARIPTSHVMSKLGWNQKFISAWNRFSSNVNRRFEVLGFVSKGVKSTCGYPEGCPLSVVACLLNCVVFDLALKLHDSRVKPNIFADNLAWLTHHAENIIPTWNMIQVYAKNFDLTVAMDKSWTWATGKEQRKFFRKHAPTPVKLDERDVGAHVSYTCCIRNKTLGKRFEEAEAAIKRLGFIQIDWQQKLSIASRGPMKKMIFGTATTSFAWNRVDILGQRTLKAAKAYVKTKGSATHKNLALSVLHLAVNPIYAVIAERIANARKQIRAEHFELIRQLRQTGLGLKAKGPISLLHEAVQILGWEMQETMDVITEEGFRFNLLDSPKNILVIHLRDAWNIAVAKGISTGEGLLGPSRKTLGQPSSLDVQLTKKAMQQLSKSEMGWVKILVGGGRFSTEIAKYNMDCDRCIFCGKKDGTYHIFETCEHFKELQQLRKGQIELWKKLTPFEKFTAVAEGISDCRKAMVALEQIPFSWPATVRNHKLERQSFFVDGSCDDPQDPVLRLSSFAVVSANPVEYMRESNENVDCGLVLHAQWLPGILQSISRAEICGILYAAAAAEFCDIYSDCKAAIDRAEQILQQPDLRIDNMMDNSDLWRLFQATVANREKDAVRLIKVQAHQRLSEDMTLEEKWIVLNNDLADREAKRINACRPQAFIRKVTRLRQVRSEKLAAIVAGMKLFAEFSEARQKAQNELKKAEKIKAGEVKGADEIQAKLELSTSIRKLERKQMPRQIMLEVFIYGQLLMDRMLGWLGGLRWPVKDFTGKGVTWLELWLDFVLTTASTMPCLNMNFYFKKGRVNTKADYVYSIEGQPQASVQQSMRKELEVFRGAFEILYDMYGSSIFLGDRSEDVQSLSSFGYQSPKQGWTKRPLLWHPDGVQLQLQVLLMDRKLDLNATAPQIEVDTPDIIVEHTYTHRLTYAQRWERRQRIKIEVGKRMPQVSEGHRHLWFLQQWNAEKRKITLRPTEEEAAAWNVMRALEEGENAG